MRNNWNFHKKKTSNIKKIFIFLIFFLLIFWIFKYQNIWNTEISKQDFTINKWDTISLIPKKFNLDVNNLLYKIWIKMNYSDFKLQAWSFTIEKPTNLNDLFSEILTRPNSKDLKITILPGWNIFDIDDYLTEKWIIEKWELINFSKNIPTEFKDKYAFLNKSDSIEGFIYPDTYRLSLTWDLNTFLNVVFDEFETKIYSNYSNTDKNYDNMIFASILEREEKNPTNKPIVSWILQKRLSENISLWADATVCYEYELTQKECTPNFINQYIYKKSSYNTRNKIWLPPTPISNFTKDTFDAVVNSKNSPYYYYLHDMDWNIHFWRTLEEHNRNKMEYLN